MRLCVLLLLLLLLLTTQVVGQELPWDKDVEKFFNSITRMHDHWSRPRPGRLEPAYSNIQVVLQRHPTNAFFIHQKILLLAEMGRWSEIERYLESLMPLASSNQEIQDVVESTRIHLRSRQDGLLPAFLAMPASYRAYFLSSFFGRALATSLLVCLTGILVHIRWRKMSSLPLGTMLFMAWAAPVAHFLSVSLTTGLYPIRPYERYQQEVLSLAIRGLSFLAVAMIYLRKHRCSHGAGTRGKWRVLLLTIAILAPVLALLPSVSWGMIEALPRNVANLGRGINAFFGALTMLHFFADVGFGVLIYCTLYGSIRSVVGPVPAVIWLVVWAHLSSLHLYMAGTRFLPSLMWQITCFWIAPLAAYEVRPSATAPIAVLWWISLLRVVYGIAGSGGWNPSLLL